jgi:hypothetical protein
MLSAQNMLRKAFGSSEGFSSAEADSVSKLVSAHQGLVTDGDVIDLKTDEGYSACVRFLADLEAASRALKLAPAPRAYRKDFTINYRALFPDDTQSYRVDVLEASADQHTVIYVNGDQFEFTSDTIRRAEELQRAIAELRTILHRYVSAKKTSAAKPTKGELQQVLEAFDSAWAGFEQRYISELIGIEVKARQLIVDAVSHEERLQELEACHDRDEKRISKELNLLVKSIARLNAVANSRRKGRDDLSAEILLSAQATLQRCNMVEQEDLSIETVAAARILATDVVESFGAMRRYLIEVKKCLERVDPHLCNNAGLVARLVDWEESWEVGAKYVLREPLLQALCDVVVEVRTAQTVAPALVDMCNDCDVELFMVLPRIIWLRFLAEPTKQAELIRTLLPERFAYGGTEAGATWDPELAAFITLYQAVNRIIETDIGEECSLQGLAWAILVKRAVRGEGGADIYAGLSPGTHTAIEDLMRDLEGRSIELQRYCAEDWNQCSAVLIQCLTGSDSEENKSPFNV